MFESAKKKVEEAMTKTISDTINEAWNTIKPIAKEAAIDVLLFKATWCFLDIFKNRVSKTHIYYHFK